MNNKRDLCMLLHTEVKLQIIHPLTSKAKAKFTEKSFLGKQISTCKVQGDFFLVTFYHIQLQCTEALTYRTLKLKQWVKIKGTGGRKQMKINKHFGGNNSKREGEEQYDEVREDVS